MSGNIKLTTKEQLTIKEEIVIELYKAAEKSKAELNELGVVGVAKQQHPPVLLSSEDFDNWARSAESCLLVETLVWTETKLEDILKDATEKKIRSLMFIASAGMGKTTLMRRIAQNAKELEGKLILLMDLSNYKTDKKILPSQALLGHMFSDWGSERMKERYQWIIDNRDKVIFIIDSHYTLPFNLDEEHQNIGYHEPATTDVILHSLMSKDWFPGSLFISFSREYKVRNLHYSMRPDCCFVLNGLTEESVEDHFGRSLGKEKGNEAIAHIKKEYPEVWPLFAEPAFLALSVPDFDERGIKAMTMSEILIKFFQNLIRSPHVNVQDISTVFKNLIDLSFNGISDRHDSFTPTYLEKFNLDPEDVAGFGIFIPESPGKFFPTKLVRNKWFCHYNNREMKQNALAALHILSESEHDFEKILPILTSKEEFALVRRFTLGILLNDEVLQAAKELIEFSDVEQKKDHLTKHIHEILNQPPDKRGLLEIYIDLRREAKSVAAKFFQSLSKIGCREINISPSDVQSITFVTQMCGRLKSFELQCCDLNADKIASLTEMTEQVSVKIAKVNVALNPNIGTAGMLLLGTFVKNCGAADINVQACKLECEHLEKFSVGAKYTRIRSLDVGGNTQLGLKGMRMLGELVDRHDVERLDASRCHPKPDQILEFVEGLGEAKLDALILEERGTEPAFTETLLKLLPHVERKLSLLGWEINRQQRQELAKHLQAKHLQAKHLQEPLKIFLDDEILSPVLDIPADEKQCSGSTGGPSQCIHVTNCRITGDAFIGDRHGIVDKRNEGNIPGSQKNTDGGKGTVYKRTHERNDEEEVPRKRKELEFSN